MYNPYPYDIDNINTLSDMYPRLAIDPYRGLPMARRGGEISFNKVRRVPHSFLYEGQLFSLPQYLDYRLKKISNLAPGQREPALQSFLRSYKQDIYNMPLANMLGPAGREAAKRTVVDVGAREAYETSTNRYQFMRDWVIQRVGEGYGFSATASHIGEFKLTRGSIMSLFPGFGGQEYLRKYATLGDYVPIGTAAGPGMGAVSRTTRTAEMGSAQRGMIQSITQGAIGDSYTRSQAVGAARSAIRNNAIVMMAQYSSDPRLAGGAVLARPGAVEGLYKYSIRDIVFGKGALAGIADEKLRAQVEGKLASGTGTLSRREMMSIYNASMTKNADYQSLLAEGLTPEQALKRLNKRIPTNFNRIMSVTQEGEDLRLFYASRSPFGAGSKVVVNQRKAIMGIAGDLPSGVDIVMSHWDKSESGRNLSRVYEAAEIWLTNKRFQKDASVSLQNAQFIADLANQQMKTQGIRERAKAMQAATGTSIYLPQQFRFNEGFVRGVVGRLSPAQQAELNKVNPTLPVYMSALREPNLAKAGAIVKYGMGDIAALEMAGQRGYASAIAAKMGANPIAQEYSRVFGYLGGVSSSVAGAVPLSAETISDTLARVTTPGGALTGRGNILFDPSVQAEYGVTRMLDLGTKVKVNTGAAEREFSQLPILSMAGRQRGLTAGGENYANEVDYAILDLLHARATGEQGGIQGAAQKYVDALGNLGGKGRALVEQTFKTRLQGVRGTLAFLRPEAESAIAATFGEAAGLPYVALTPQQARSAIGGISLKELRKQVYGEGIYLPVNRPPGFPQGTGFARLALIEGDIKNKMVNFGYGETAYVSLGLGSHLGGDEDKDPLAAIGEYALNRELQKQAKAARMGMAARYMQSGQAAMDEIARPARGFLEESIALSQATELSALEVGYAAQQKFATTGLVHNLARDRVREGALRMSGQPTFEHFTEDYINKMTMATARLSEAGIDIKQASKAELAEVLGTDPLKAFYSGSAAKRTGNISPILTKYITREFGSGANVRSVARDIVESVIAGGEGAMTRIASTNYGSTIDEYVRAIAPDISAVGQRGTGAALAAGGVIHPRTPTAPMSEVTTKTVGTINKEIEAAAAERINRTTSVIAEGVQNAFANLKEGHGWTGLAIGGAVLAGVGLSMRKPGNIVVISNSRKDEQTRADGSYIKTREAQMPVIVPRKESAARLMTQRQYDVRIAMKDVRREHATRKHMIDLGNLISGKYRQPAKVHVNINDDSRDLDYQQIFTRAYNQQMSLG